MVGIYESLMDYTDAVDAENTNVLKKNKYFRRQL